MRRPRPLHPVSKTWRSCSATVCSPPVAFAAEVGLGKIVHVRRPLSCAVTRPIYPCLLKMTWHNCRMLRKVTRRVDYADDPS
jgi:hypothetical protein